MCIYVLCVELCLIYMENATLKNSLLILIASNVIRGNRATYGHP